MKEYNNQPRVHKLVKSKQNNQGIKIIFKKQNLYKMRLYNTSNNKNCKEIATNFAKGALHQISAPQKYVQKHGFKSAIFMLSGAIILIRYNIGNR